MKKNIKRTLFLALFLAITVFSNEGVSYYRQDIPSAVCYLQLVNKGGTLLWSCPPGGNSAFQYYDTYAESGEKKIFTYYSDAVIINVQEGFGALTVSPRYGNYPSVLFIQGKGQPQPTQPIIPTGDCDFMDRDLITGRCAGYSGGGSSGGGGGDISSCLKAADDAERTANMMDEGVAKTMLMQNVIAARARCYSH